MRFIVLTMALLSTVGLSKAPLNSALSTTSKVTGDSVEMVVKVIPKKDLVMNFEGPWSLKIINAGGLKGLPEKLTLKDFDRVKQEFKLKGKTAGLKKGEVKVQAAVFVCVEDKKTKEKTECFRDIHDQTIKWGA